jgi:hypothetical protein
MVRMSVTVMRSASRASRQQTRERWVSWRTGMNGPTRYGHRAREAIRRCKIVGAARCGGRRADVSSAGMSMPPPLSVPADAFAAEVA